MARKTKLFTTMAYRLAMICVQYIDVHHFPPSFHPSFCSVLLPSLVSSLCYVILCVAVSCRNQRLIRRVFQTDCCVLKYHIAELQVTLKSCTRWILYKITNTLNLMKMIQNDRTREAYLWRFLSVSSISIFRSPINNPPSPNPPLCCIQFTVVHVLSNTANSRSPRPLPCRLPHPHPLHTHSLPATL